MFWCTLSPSIHARYGTVCASLVIIHDIGGRHHQLGDRGQQTKMLLMPSLSLVQRFSRLPKSVSRRCAPCHRAAQP